MFNDNLVLVVWHAKFISYIQATVYMRPYMWQVLVISLAVYNPGVKING